VEEIPQEHAYLQQLRAAPQATFIGQRPWRFAVVDLARVISFQQFVVESRILVPDNVAAFDFEAKLRYTLQVPTPRNVAVSQGPGNQYTLSSLDVNLRIAGQAQAETPQGRILGFVISHGVPWMQVVAFR